MDQAQALIIDDNARNGNVLSLLLGDEGVENTVITDPKQLEATVNDSSRFNIVFLDLEFPGINGYEILEALQSDPHFEGVPIVAYTVHTSEINKAYETGFHSFIGKPINSEKFPSQLARILNGEHVWETV